MNKARRGLLLPGVLILLVVRFSGADDAATYVDNANSCTVKAGSDWQRLATAEKNHTQLALEYVGDKPGELHPMFLILTVTTEDSVDKSARDLLDAAKAKVADQGDYGTISKVKLDGEDARLVVTKTIIAGKAAIRKQIVAKHNGKTFIADFFTGEDDFKRQLPAADMIFDSFQWK